jgi:Protein of unknown function (DUF3551)
MSHPSLRNVAFSSATVNRAGVTRQGLSRTGAATIAALVLAAGAFISTAPAVAATSSEHAVYCLSSDSQNDCGFVSLAQCQATASGGLGVCSMMPAWSEQRGRNAFDRFQARSYR